METKPTYKTNMIPVRDVLPEIGSTVKCLANFWRFGVIHHTEVVEAEYLGDNFLGSPMFDIDTYDMAYAEVTHWKPL